MCACLPTRLSLAMCKLHKCRIMADWIEVPRCHRKALQRSEPVWYEFLWILSGAVWLYNFPDVWGSVSRRPIGYCCVCVPVVIWVVHWLNTDFDALLMLCVQQQNVAHSPPGRFRVGWYRDGEACWLIILIIAPSVMPEEKFKIICRAGKRLCMSTPTLVWVQCRGVDSVLHPCEDKTLVIIATQELHRLSPGAVQVSAISQSRFR